MLICLAPGEEIGDEVHQKIDQFFRIEHGVARFVFNEGPEHVVREGDVAVVPTTT